MFSDTLFGIAVGIGLSAACGFRVFVPLLVTNLATLTGHFHLAPGFEWIGSDYATIAFGTATLVEILAYYIPWLDHIMDLIASPAAIIAGMVVTASVVMNISPSLRWTLAIIAGGGAAAIVQGVTVALRTKSSVLTAGAGNVLASSAELAGSIMTTFLAIVVPVLCLILVSLFCIFVIWKAGHLFFGRMKIK
jgi:Domain of unknown function (DUF4126)